MDKRQEIYRLKERIQSKIIGQEKIVQRLLVGLLANGNLLVEGLPGLAKTRAIKSMSSFIESDFSRIQFTPDLLPSDVTGSENMYEDSGEYKFRFEKGPIFGNIILADEINRAPAKVQSAMLEAMEERQVTIAGKTYKMPELFMVMATQNPVEQEGTYPLPEAQMDRFLLHVNIEYLNSTDELKMLQVLKSENSTVKDDTKISQEAIFGAREEIQSVQISQEIERYIVDLVFATRYPEKYSEELASYIDVGVSPRATIGLELCSRVYAYLDGRDVVRSDDVKAMVNDVFRHRITLSYEAMANSKSADDVIDLLVKNVAVAL
ncbi:MAG: AAA family ATPase [Campylobacterota bacterium]|nr:AAA family ATPase [Campylobacterota bacterium]